MAANGHPKVFISYSWTSEAYKERVLKLAERLMDNGVDVILDQWDLSPGKTCMLSWSKAFMKRRKF